MTRDELDRIESGTDAATPGPWQAGYWDDARTPLENFDTNAPDDATGGSVYAIAPESVVSVADARTLSRGATGEGDSVRSVALPLRPHDAAFIASARQDVPALVSALRECDRRFAALSPNGDLLDALLAVLSSPGNDAARAHFALIAARGAGVQVTWVERQLPIAFGAASVPVAPVADAFAEVELSPANAEFVRRVLGGAYDAATKRGGCDMKTVGELHLKPGDVMKREDGTLGVVVPDDSPGWRDLKRTFVWWHHEAAPTAYCDRESVAWEVVPKPVPTVASLKLAPGDVVRWQGRNWLVQLADELHASVMDASGNSVLLSNTDPIPEGFRKVQT